MKKIAIVNKIKEDIVFATYNKNESGGHSKAFFKTNEDLTFKVSNSRGLALNSGDSIEIFIEPKSAITLSFFMFIMPLIIFMTTYSVMGSLVQSSSEIVKILIGVIGIVASFVLTYIFFKIKPQKLPEITRVLTGIVGGSNTCSTCGSCTSCG